MPTAPVNGRTDILHELDARGGFTAVDLVSGVSAYAYPTSHYAICAAGNRHRTAAEMIKQEIKARAWWPSTVPANAAAVDAERIARLTAALRPACVLVA